MKAFLTSYGFGSSKNITKDKYQEIVEKVGAGNLSAVEIPDECITFINDVAVTCKKHGDCPIKHIAGARAECEKGVFE